MHSSPTNNPNPNNPPKYRIQTYKPQHATLPYTPQDFTRLDPSPDTTFYATPRFVTHIDDAAIASLKEYYAAVLPRQGRILDFCSSWTSHYPDCISQAAASSQATPDGEERDPPLKITTTGLNQAELAANKISNAGRLVHDLNTNPDLASLLKSTKLLGPTDSDLLDASTCAVSIDYLTSPVSVLRSLRSVTKPGGTVHLVVSNRCFPTKATRLWLRSGEKERLRVVGDFLWFAGWRDIEIVEVSDGQVGEGSSGGGDGVQGNSLQGLMGWMGVGGRDPLWVVRGVNLVEGE